MWRGSPFRSADTGRARRRVPGGAVERRVPRRARVVAVRDDGPQELDDRAVHLSVAEDEVFDVVDGAGADPERPGHGVRLAGRGERADADQLALVVVLVLDEDGGDGLTLGVEVAPLPYLELGGLPGARLRADGRRPGSERAREEVEPAGLFRSGGRGAAVDAGGDGKDRDRCAVRKTQAGGGDARGAARGHRRLGLGRCTRKRFDGHRSVLHVLLSAVGIPSALAGELAVARAAREDAFGYLGGRVAWVAALGRVRQGNAVRGVHGRGGRGSPGAASCSRSTGPVPSCSWSWAAPGSGRPWAASSSGETYRWPSTREPIRMPSGASGNSAAGTANVFVPTVRSLGVWATAHRANARRCSRVGWMWMRSVRAGRGEVLPRGTEDDRVDHYPQGLLGPLAVEPIEDRAVRVDGVRCVGDETDVAAGELACAFWFRIILGYTPSRSWRVWSTPMASPSASAATNRPRRSGDFLLLAVSFLTPPSSSFSGAVHSEGQLDDMGEPGFR